MAQVPDVTFPFNLGSGLAVSSWVGFLLRNRTMIVRAWDPAAGPHKTVGSQSFKGGHKGNSPRINYKMQLEDIKISI